MAQGGQILQTQEEEVERYRSDNTTAQKDGTTEVVQVEYLVKEIVHDGDCPMYR